MTYDTRLWEFQQANAQAEQYRMNQSTSKKNINDYSEALFQSIDTIVGERIKRLPYDYTIVATITNADNAYIGAYKVTTDNNTIFTAYSEVKTYSVGDRVYIRIIDTNYNSSKVITGKYIEHVNIQNTSDSDIINYLIENSNPNNPDNYLPINKELAAQGYFLQIEGVNDASKKEYSPDSDTTLTPILNIKFYKLIIEDDQFIARPIQSGYEYNYGINDGTQVFNNNIILEGQYGEIITKPLGTQIDNFSFIPIQQTVQQYVSIRCYITLTSGIIIRSNVFIIKSNTKLSKQYRHFTITTTQDQFFIFNAKGKRLTSASTIATITYINTFDNTSAKFETGDQIIITSSLGGDSMFTYTNFISPENTKIVNIEFELNDTLLTTSFLVETLTFTIIKDSVEYVLTKDFYFGYQQIDSIINSDAIQLYLNNNDILKYYKLKIGDLFEAGPGETVKIGGSNYAVTNGNWAGNAATATTATKLAAAPSLAANGNTITITAGEKTSVAFTVPFATTATTATELADAPSLAANNNKITITAGGKTSSAFTVPYASTAATATTAAAADKINTNAGSLTTPVYFTGGVPVIITSLDETLLGFNSSNSNFSSNGQNTKLYEWLKAIQTNMNTLAAQHNITLTWPATL